MSNPALKATALVKEYSEGERTLRILDQLDFEVEKGESVAIVGASGSGKSTLLNLLGGLDQFDAGDVEIGGESVSRMSERRRCQLRNTQLGFVYQFHHLLPEFSALENVAIPLMLGRHSAPESKARAAKALQQVGLGERLSHRPSQLSGGERQRVAIARALVTEPQCVLMDEPTGNLDQETAMAVQALIEELRARVNTAFVVVTHDRELASRMNRSFELKGGKLQRLS